jgi:hypothetical protein
MTAAPDPLDLLDALHPAEGATPEQPPEPLGASPDADGTEGTPPFVMRRLSLDDWAAYVAGYVFAWRLPSRLVLHHTWKPTAATWAGYATMRGMQRYYAGLGWTSAPHIYCAPDGIWLATPLSRIGIHAGAGNGSLAQGWYSIGIEMVGDFDEQRPDGATWQHTRAVLSGLQARIGRPLASILSFHNQYSSKSCPGRAVTREWVLSQVTPANPAMLSTPASPLLGPPSGTAESAIVYLAHRATQYEPGDVAAIVSAYQREGRAAGVDWFLALAQLAHETGGLTSWWCARPRRNPAGIGVTGETWRGDSPPLGMAWAGPDTAGVWRRGLSFARWDPDAVRAHLGRLLAYALPVGEGTPVQQALVAQALALRPLPASYRGVAPTLAGLDGRWASPGVGYAARVAAVANRMRQGGG